MSLTSPWEVFNHYLLQYLFWLSPFFPSWKSDNMNIRFSGTHRSLKFSSFFLSLFPVVQIGYFLLFYLQVLIISDYCFLLRLFMNFFNLFGGSRISIWFFISFCSLEPFHDACSKIFCLITPGALSAYC